MVQSIKVVGCRALITLCSVLVHLCALALLLWAQPRALTMHDQRPDEVVQVVWLSRVTGRAESEHEIVEKLDRSVPPRHRLSRVMPYSPLYFGQSLALSQGSPCNLGERLLDKTGGCDEQVFDHPGAPHELARQPLLKDDIENEIFTRAEQEGLVKLVPKVPWYRHEDILP